MFVIKATFWISRWHKKCDQSFRKDTEEIVRCGRESNLNQILKTLKLIQTLSNLSTITFKIVIPVVPTWEENCDIILNVVALIVASLHYTAYFNLWFRLRAHA